MSVAAILQQLAENAGRTQRIRGALAANTVTDLSLAPAQIINDRERLRQQQIQEARQAEMLGFARNEDVRRGNADARSKADQDLQDAAAKRALDHEAVVGAGLAAAIGPDGDPSKFDGRAAFDAVSKLGKPEAITDVIKRHRELQAKPLILKPGDVGFNPDTNAPIPGLNAPEKKPDYTIGGQRFSGDGTPIGPLVPRQTAPVVGTIHDTPSGLVRIGPDNSVTPVRDANGQPLRGYHPPTSAAPGAEVIKLTPSGIDIAALNYKKTGQMPPLGMGDKGNRQSIINRAAELTAEDVQRIEAGGGDIATNKGTFAADTASLRDLTKVLDASSAFSNTMHDNFKLMQEAAKDIVDTGSPWLNQPLRVVAKKLAGSEAQSAFETYRSVVVPEAAKILSSPTASGQLTDSARKEMEEVVSGGGTLKQLIAVADALEKDAANKRRNYQGQIDVVKGRMKGGANSTPQATHRYNPATGQVEEIKK